MFFRALGEKKGKVDASQVLCLIPLVTWLSLYRSTDLWPNKATFKLFRSYSSPPLLWMNSFSPAFSKPLVEKVLLWPGRSLKRSLSSREQRQKLWLRADSECFACRTFMCIIYFFLCFHEIVHKVRARNSILKQLLCFTVFFFLWPKCCLCSTFFFLLFLDVIFSAYFVKYRLLAAGIHNDKCLRDLWICILSWC